MKIVDDTLLAELLGKAAAALRRRTNYNLHDSTEEPTNRLLNAMQPDTVIAPHRHPGKWELFSLLSGRIGVYLYDDAGRITETVTLGDGVRVVEIPPNVWHNFVALEPSVALEVKPGPYAPLAPEDAAPFPGVRPEDSAQ